MAAGEHLSVEPGLLRALARHLEHLKSHPQGGELHQLIKNAVVYCREHGYVNGSCIAYLHGLLLAYTKDQTRPFPIRIRARLIQQHFALYLPDADHVVAANKTTALESKPSQTKPTHDAGANLAHKSSPTPHREKSKTNLTSTETVVMESQATAEINKTSETDTPARVHAGHASPQNLNELREIWSNSVNELLREREALSQKLSDATNYLKMIEAEREQLHVELNKARKRGRVNEKTTKKVLGIPKRDVLVRQIESEVERVKRHGNPLALALIDIEDMEKINQQHGQEVAKAVLQHYTGEILGSFRSYDMVARYNKDEFAVLLPNTDKDNAMRALDKVRKRAMESHFSHKGKSFPMPSFGGVLTFYARGEEPQQMLRRADEALVNLKLRGERQVVVV
ncbi:MAG: GGDEF domain-containing protein [Gammaproteobacteria bacterium]|nr:GGDEF domain-containing protein [Gammaproteobacteria bacterium]